MEVTGAAAILAYSWLAGFLVLRAAHGSEAQSDADTAVQAGYGYFLGLLLAVVFLKTWAWLGLGVSMLPTLLSLALVAALATVWTLRRNPVPVPTDTLATWWHGATAWQRTGVAVLAGLILFRLGLLGLEAGLRPLFPWDAWMHWAPKARVWMETGEWARFGPMWEWLAQGGEGVYSFRNWRYPEFVPLIQVWALLPAGRWHEIAFGVPWIGAALALAPAAYGQARLLGSTPLVALLFAWLLLSLPIMNVHVALPGYADLWMGVYTGLAAASLLVWSRTRRPDQLALAVMLGAALAWIKIPGLVWMLILVPGLLATLFPVRWSAGLIGGLLVAGLALILAGGIELRLPGAGEVVINSERILLPVIGEFRWSPQPVAGDLLGQLFASPNWHLGWYLAAIGLAAGLAVCVRDRTRLAAIVMAAGGLAFLLVALLLTRRGAGVEDIRTTHRAFMHAVPMLAFCLLALLSTRDLDKTDTSA